MISSPFIWPRSRPSRALVHTFRFASFEKVEARLANMFPGGTPVLFSSGRAALTFSLLISGLSRGDKVGIFPFASHCVLDAVSRVATPIGLDNLPNLKVVFQQWGFSQNHSLSANDVEDCVDSLLIPGGKLFQGGGGFEIWSLPKILGTTGGGVLWCRSYEVAVALRQLRNDRKNATLLWGLRLLGHYTTLVHTLWQGAEASMGKPSRLQTGEILDALDGWDDIVTDRRRKFDLVRPFAPGWLRLQSDRLPCAVPVVLKQDYDGEMLSLQAGISSGQRMIERHFDSGASELVRVLPIPIHQDINIRQLRIILNLIKPYIRNDV